MSDVLKKELISDLTKCIRSDRRPHLSEVFHSKYTQTTSGSGSEDSNTEFVELAKKLVERDDDSQIDEYVLDQLFPYFSIAAYRYYFPKILLGLITETYPSDGNLAATFYDAIDIHRKFGRGQHVTMLREFSQSLSDDKRNLLDACIALLGTSEDELPLNGCL